MSIEQKISQLEQAAFDQLENPDGVKEDINYQFDVTDGFTLLLASEARNERETYADMGLGLPRTTTNAFIFHTGGLTQRRQRNAIAFSSLYHQEPEELVRGVQYFAPHEMPSTKLADEFLRGKGSNVVARDLIDAESALYGATFDLAQYIDGHTKNDTKYSQPPIDNESLPRCSDDEFARYHEWSTSHSYKLSLAGEMARPVQDFLRTANALLAEGTIIIDLNLYRGYDIDKNKDSDASEGRISIESHEVRRRNAPALGELAITIEIYESGIQHVFERDKNGRVEIRLHNADPVERYRGLKSFDPIIEEDGTIEGFGWDDNEFAQILEQERATGMFVPTEERIDFFQQRIEQIT